MVGDDVCIGDAGGVGVVDSYSGVGCDCGDVGGGIGDGGDVIVFFSGSRCHWCCS